MTLLTLVFLTAGLVLLLVGAEVLVRGASRLAAAAGVTPLVIGLTVVAFGTSAPELAVSLQGAYTGNAAVTIGNVIGSNIFNVLLILGLSALAAPLVVASRLLRWDVPLMIAASLVVWLMALDGAIGRLEGIMLALGLAAYLGFALRQARREPPAVQAEFAEAMPEAPGQPSGVLASVLMVVVGLVLLVLGARWLVDSAVTIARGLGVSELVIGLTLVAGGTSLPEVATSVVASLRGERDLAVGNVVGSNLFNLLAVLGISAAVAPAALEVPAAALAFDMPVMVVAAVACLPVLFTGSRIDRWEGGLFVAYYALYTLALLMRATDSALLGPFASAMFFFVLPLTAITLLVGVLRAVHNGRRNEA